MGFPCRAGLCWLQVGGSGHTSPSSPAHFGDLSHNTRCTLPCRTSLLLAMQALWSLGAQPGLTPLLEPFPENCLLPHSIPPSMPLHPTMTPPTHTHIGIVCSIFWASLSPTPPFIQHVIHNPGAPTMSKTPVWCWTNCRGQNRQAPPLDLRELT